MGRGVVAGVMVPKLDIWLVSRRRGIRSIRARRRGILGTKAMRWGRGGMRGISVVVFCDRIDKTFDLSMRFMN
jgi:hypothetical protein